MTELFLNVFQILALVDEYRSEGVAQVVEADSFKPSSFEGWLEDALLKVGLIEWCASGRCEHQVELIRYGS